MKNILYFLQKTIGQKMVAGITGLGLCLFVLIHMLGNLLILKGADAYNEYAYKLHEFVLFEILEKGIMLLFVGHISFTLFINWKNKQASGASNKKQASGQKKTLLADRLLVFQGVILFVFVAYHLITFKFGAHYTTYLNGKEVRDIYLLVTEVFKNPLYVVGYVIALFILGVHLIHGLPASLKTLGFYHPRYMLILKIIGWIFAIFITLGFTGPVLYIYFLL